MAYTVHYHPDLNVLQISNDPDAIVFIGRAEIPGLLADILRAVAAAIPEPADEFSRKVPDTPALRLVRSLGPDESGGAA